MSQQEQTELSAGWPGLAMRTNTVQPQDFDDASHTHLLLDGGSTKSLLFTCSPVKALQGEEALMSVICWRSGRIDRACRGAVCAETRAMVDLEDELFALRYQWSEMLGNTALEKSTDEMVRHTPGACVTDSKGLYGRMQRTAITPEGKERRVDIECLVLRERLGFSSANFFSGYTTVERSLGTVLPKTRTRSLPHPF